jgi:DNA-binding MltR family transcriptional regulator
MPVEVLSYRNQDEKDAHAEILESPDRVAAIVSAAFVDDRLAAALKARMHHDKDITERMFHHAGPLGTFSAKIDFAFLIGMFSKEAVQDLHTIRQVRNEFAHTLKTKSFNAQRIRDLIKNIRIVRRQRITASGGKNELTMEIFPAFDKAAPPTPREVYIKSCQYFIVLLDYYFSIYPKPPKAEI